MSKHPKDNSSKPVEPLNFTKVTPKADPNALLDFLTAKPNTPGTGLGNNFSTGFSKFTAPPATGGLKKDPLTIVRLQAAPSRVKPSSGEVKTFSELWLERYAEWNEIVEAFEQKVSRERNALREILNSPRPKYDEILKLIPSDRPEAKAALLELKEGSRRQRAMTEAVISGLWPEMLLNSTQWNDVQKSSAMLLRLGLRALGTISEVEKCELQHEDGTTLKQGKMGVLLKGTARIQNGEEKPLAQIDGSLETLRAYYNAMQAILPRLYSHQDKAGKTHVAMPDLQLVEQVNEVVQTFTRRASLDAALLGENTAGLNKEQRKAREAERKTLDAKESDFRPSLLEAVQLTAEDWNSALETWRKEPSTTQTTNAIERLRFTVHDVISTAYQMAGGSKNIPTEPDVLIEPHHAQAAATELKKSAATRGGNLLHLMNEAYTAYTAIHLWEQGKAAPADTLVALEAVQTAARLYHPHYKQAVLEPLTPGQEPRAVATTVSSTTNAQPLIIENPKSATK